MENPGSPKPGSQKRKMPSPQELVSHYESQGLDRNYAALKAIEDLQATLLRLASSRRKEAAAGDPGRKLDTVNARLAVVSAKLDSKPSFPQTFALGVASGLTLNGLSAVAPHVVGALSQVWKSAASVNRD